MARFCENCGYEISSSDKFCEKCGNQIIKYKSNNNAENKHCSKCGALIEENSIFCTVCGFTVGVLPQKNYNLFLIFGYLSAIGLYLMTRPETQHTKILYLHGVLLVVMPLGFFFCSMFFWLCDYMTKENLRQDEFYNKIAEIDNLKSLLNTATNVNVPQILLTGLRSVEKQYFLKKLKRN